MLPAVAAVAIVFAVAAVVAFTGSSQLRPVSLQQQQQQTMMLNGFTYQMQQEADKALRLCDVGLLGPGQHCAKHVVSTDDTKWTHTETGQNVWEESQRFMDNQNAVAPQGPEIGTPGDFGDRR